MKRVLTTAVLAALFAGCRHGPTCPTVLISDPGMALLSHQKQSAKIRSVRAEAKVDQRGKEGRIKGRVMMFVERPNRVRFDAMTQFGPALILTSDGETFALSDFKQDRYFTGPACESNIARMIGVALSGEDVASVLLGDSPLLMASDQQVLCSGEGSYLVERRSDAGSRQELELRIDEQDFDKPPAEQRLTLASTTFWDPAGKRLYRVRYDDYRGVGANARLPFTVRIDDFVNDADVVLRFQSIAVDVQVPVDAFQQAPRAGLNVEQLACEP